MAKRQNIDIEALESFRTLLEQEPDKGKLHLEAKAVYEGQAGRSMVHVGPFGLDDVVIDRPTRHYTFPFGGWREVESMIGMDGATDRMEPVEMVLASIAACLVSSVSVNAARLGIDTDGLEIKVSTTIDPRVMLAVRGPEEHGNSLGSIKYDVKVRGDVSDDEMEMIDKLCAYSPVYGMVSGAITISGDVSRVSTHPEVSGEVGN